MKRQWIQYERKRELTVPRLFDEPRYVAGFIILALGAFCVFQAWYLLFYSSYFTLEGITVKGNRTVETEMILTLGKLEMGQRTFGMDFEEIARKISEHPRISEASLLQISPRKVQITITERKEWLQVWGQSSVFGVTEEGFFFPIQDPGTKPRIRIKLGESEWKIFRLSQEKQELLKQWVEILEKSPLAQFDVLSLEDLSTFFVTFQGIRIYLEDVERFLEHQSKIPIFLKEVLQTGKTIEYIDARFEDMVVKMG
ncbi:FtsQ-type POTRA domain-containing protein [bacterium]|jgi:cell division septal protein FtsQ|nr:FtsQ-type POTRA domain-containing protein [bacterium]